MCFKEKREESGAEKTRTLFSVCRTLFSVMILVVVVGVVVEKKKKRKEETRYKRKSISASSQRVALDEPKTGVFVF